MVGVKHPGSDSISTTGLHRNVYRIKNAEVDIAPFAFNVELHSEKGDRPWVKLSPF